MFERHQCDSFQVKDHVVFSCVPHKCPDLPVYLKAWGKFQRNSQQGNAAFFIWVIHIESERLLSQAQLAVCCCLKSLAIWDYTKHLLKVQKILSATLENVIKVIFVVCILHKNINNFFFWVLLWLSQQRQEGSVIFLIFHGLPQAFQIVQRDLWNTWWKGGGSLLLLLHREAECSHIFYCF